MYAFVLALVMFSLSEPASFEYRLAGNTDAVVKLEDTVLKEGNVYVVGPAFIGERTIPLTVTYIDGEERVTGTLNIRLRAGRHMNYTITVPGGARVVLVRAGP